MSSSVTLQYIDAEPTGSMAIPSIHTSQCSDVALSNPYRREALYRVKRYILALVWPCLASCQWHAPNMLIGYRTCGMMSLHRSQQAQQRSLGI
jgi:hypothetical protein